MQTKELYDGMDRTSMKADDLNSSKFHINGKTQDTREVVFCSLCGTVFTNEKMLTNHIRDDHRHFSDVMPIDATSISQEGNSMQRNLDKTINSTHPVTAESQQSLNYLGQCDKSNIKQAKSITDPNGESSFPCPVCSKKFSRKYNMEVHMRTHTGEKPHKCTMCDKTFIVANNLKTHMRTHTGEKPYKCTMCDKSFSHDASLKGHLRLHTGERPYTCSLCEKNFTRSDDLRSHMRTHTGEKPYKCTECDKKFTTSGNLRTHMRIHTGERPYKCNHCDKMYLQLGDLQVHMRRHTGEKPYRCMACGKAFVRSGHLNAHMRSHMRKWRKFENFWQTHGSPSFCTSVDSGGNVPHNLMFGSAPSPLNVQVNGSCDDAPHCVTSAGTSCEDDPPVAQSSSPKFPTEESRRDLDLLPSDSYPFEVKEREQGPFDMQTNSLSGSVKFQELGRGEQSPARCAMELTDVGEVQHSVAVPGIVPNIKSETMNDFGSINSQVFTAVKDHKQSCDIKSAESATCMEGVSEAEVGTAQNDLKYKLYMKTEVSAVNTTGPMTKSLIEREPLDRVKRVCEIEKASIRNQCTGESDQGCRNPLSCHICLALFTNVLILKQHLRNDHGVFGGSLASELYTSSDEQNTRNLSPSSYADENAHSTQSDMDSYRGPTNGNLLGKLLLNKMLTQTESDDEIRGTNSCRSDGRGYVSQLNGLFLDKVLLNKLIPSSDGEATSRVEVGWSCRVCGKTFSRKYNLETHMRTHTGEKPFKCSVCEKTFIVASNMKTHMRTHTGEKPYKCTICDKAFSHGGTFRMHMRIHMGERPFPCTMCDKRFTNSCDMKAHMRKHTGEKPYKCSVCGKNFTTNGNLRTHVQKHHAVMVEK